MKQLLKFYFKTFSFIFPQIAGKQAFNLFQRPFKNKVRDRELALYKFADRFEVYDDHENIQGFSLGPLDGPLIFMLHGWESNAGSLSELAFKLAKQGNRVLLFNLPAHAYSKRKKVNIKIARETFNAVLTHFKPQKPFSVLAHSFGSTVAAYTLSKSDYKVDKLVFLTIPNRVLDIFANFSKFIGLNKKAFQKLCAEAENILHEPLSAIAVEDMHSKINYNAALLIHDVDDKIVLKKESEAIVFKWQRADLFLIKGSGHYRMLSDKRVIEKVLHHFNTKKYSLLDFDIPISIAS